MTLLGIFSIGIYSYWAAKHRGYNEVDVIITLLVSAIGVFLGSHLLYAMVNYKQVINLIQNFNKNCSFSQFTYLLNLAFGGSVFYGGLFGGILITTIIFRNKRKDFINQIDLIAPGIPLFHFFGRIGCFLAGCCFGKACNFGFTYSHSIIEAANGVKRFPVQLLEALINFLLFLMLSNEYVYKKFEGSLFLLYLFAYSIARFFIEFFRGDTYRGIWFFLSTSQWISIVLFILSLKMLWNKMIIINKHKEYR